MWSGFVEGVKYRGRGYTFFCKGTRYIIPERIINTILYIPQCEEAARTQREINNMSMEDTLSSKSTHPLDQFNIFQDIDYSAIAEAVEKDPTIARSLGKGIYYIQPILDARKRKQERKKMDSEERERQDAVDAYIKNQETTKRRSKKAQLAEERRERRILREERKRQEQERKEAKQREKDRKIMLKALKKRFFR